MARLDLTATVVALDALHTQAETARYLAGDKHAHYLMIIKGNQPGLLEAVAAALAGPDEDFADAAWAEEGTGHGRPSGAASAPPPRRHHLATRRPGLPHPPRQRPHPRPMDPQGDCLRHHQPARPVAGPRHLGIYARNHWSIENREHYVRDSTFSEDLQKVRTGNQPNAYAAIRNLVTGAFRRAGFANIAHARRYYGRDDQRILALYGYA